MRVRNDEGRAEGKEKRWPGEGKGRGVQDVTATPAIG